MDDLRLMVIGYRETFGRAPAELAIGRAVAERLADELWDQQASYFTGPKFTREYAMDALLSGEMRSMDVPVRVETVFPTPEQVQAIEGYRQVGPC